MAKRRRYRLKKKVKRFLRRLFAIVLLIIVFSIIRNKPKGTLATPDGQDDTNNTVVNQINNISKDMYLIKGEEYKLNYADNTYYSISNNEIISFDNGILKGIAAGSAVLTITNENDKYDINVTVTDLLVPATINNKKEYLKCHVYTNEQASLIDKVLEYKINEKGYNTRAGAVEAARYLTLNFPYKLKYFYENGRLDRSNSFFDYVDGEGRYYHKGLYLTDNKFSDLKATLRGPNPWGCLIYNDTSKAERSNGLDCSGFITWALVNAGYDPGDVGAGPNQYNDITDIGTIVYFTDEDAFNKVKVGDLIGRQGHIGMIIGIKDGKYYVAEALDSGEYDMHVYSYTKDELLKSDFNYFVDLSSFYKEDGNLTNYWN